MSYPREDKRFCQLSPLDDFGGSRNGNLFVHEKLNNQFGEEKIIEI